MIADKAREKVGGVVINKRIETERVEVAIPVERERIQIDRCDPFDRAAIPVEDVQFGNGRVRMETYEQMPQVSKEAFVQEEVEIAKTIDRETATAQDTLRYEELEVHTERLPVDRNSHPDRQNGHN